MPDKKLTDNEIIKALECCFIEQQCNYCPLYKEHSADCLDTVLKNAHALITRQKTENENLKVENQSLRSAANSLKMHYEEAQAEIERLKIELDFAKAFRKETDAEFSLMHRKYGNMLKTTKTEAYKEVFEKLNKKAEVGKIIDKNFPFIIRVVTLHDINELKKEMMGDDND